VATSIALARASSRRSGRGPKTVTLQIEKLKFQIAKLRRSQFGRSSEKINRKIRR